MGGLVLRMVLHAATSLQFVGLSTSLVHKVHAYTIRVIHALDSRHTRWGMRKLPYVRFVGRDTSKRFVGDTEM